MLCDRETTNFAQSQYNFLTFVSQPFFENLSLIIPKLSENTEQIKKNAEEYKSKIEKYEKIKEEGNKIF